MFMESKELPVYLHTCVHTQIIAWIFLCIPLMCNKLANIYTYIYALHANLYIYHLSIYAYIYSLYHVLP